MTMGKLPAVSIVALLAGMSAACSASPGTTTTTTPPPPSTGLPPILTPQETAQEGTLPCNLETSGKLPSDWAFKNDGDNACIAPPPNGSGMQFHYGPTNYNDPVEVGKYTLAPGGEVTDCTFFVTTNTETKYFDSYHSRMRPGSHHMLLYTQPVNQTGPSFGGAGGGISLGSKGSTTVMETGNSGPTNCNQGLATRNLFGAQTAYLDVSALTAGAPENDGLAVDIAPMQQGVLQAHFINATSNPILREVWANVMYVDKSQVTQLGDPIFWIAGATMNIPMGQSKAITGIAQVPTQAAPDFRLVIGTGHYHAHTTRFQAWATVAGEKSQIIDEYGILGVAPEPQTWYFDSAKTNPVPNPTMQTAGAYSGILHLGVGDSVSWECDITNNNVPGGIQFANAVYTGEMCNMFGMYVPGINDSPWSATNL